MSTGIERSLDATDSSLMEPAPCAAVSVAAVPEPSQPAAARLIEYERGRYIALPLHTTYALIEHPVAAGVPGAARYAYGLLAWQGMQLPLIDLSALLQTNSSTVPTSAPRYALVVAYQGVARGPVAYGAIGLAGLPQAIAVGDEAQCEPPDDSKLWPLLALSCFQHKGLAVPILDTARLFAAYHS